MARIRSRRPEDGAPDEGLPRQEAPGGPSEQPTVVAPAVDDASAQAAEAGGLPAGADAAAIAQPSFRDRGRLRRRLRYLRRVRELALRDLGGLVLDLDRFGRDRPDLVRGKLDGLRAIDGELRRLEIALDDVRAVEELEEPGIAACAHCGALHGSDARFCPACGVAVGTAVAPPATEVAEAPAEPGGATSPDAQAPAIGEPGDAAADAVVAAPSPRA